MLKKTLLTAIVASVVTTVCAQDETERIVRAPSITRTYPPAESERVPPGTEKVVVFAREPVEGSKPDDWNFMASAWEFVPSAKESRLVKRCDFVPSHWEPDLLFDYERDLREFVRLQVVNTRAPRGYTVALYSIDYRTWSVSTLLETKQAFGLGANKDVVYLNTDQGVRLLDRRTKALREPEVPWRFVHDFEDRWLVVVDNPDKRTGALFDPSSGKLSETRFAFPEDWGDRPFLLVDRYHLVLSPDHARIAAVDALCSDDPKGIRFGETRVLKTKLEVLTLATGKVERFPLRLLCTGGSGRPVIPWTLRVEWSPDGAQLRVWSQRTREGAKDPAEPDSNALEVVTLDASTLEVKTREDVVEEPRKPASPQSAIPDYLKKDYDTLRETSAEGGRRLAHAFLRFHGSKHEIPCAVGETQVSFSPDGKRFLFKMWTGKSNEAFYFGDLETKALRTIPSPSSLRHAVIKMAWVEAGT